MKKTEARTELRSAILRAIDEHVEGLGTGDVLAVLGEVVTLEANTSEEQGPEDDEIEAEAVTPEPAPSAQPVQPTDEQRAREISRFWTDDSLDQRIAAALQRERRETAERVCNNVRKHFYPRADHRYPGVQIAEWLDEAGKAEGV